MNEINCYNCFWMRGKLPIKNGKLLYKKYTASCVKGNIKYCLTENFRKFKPFLTGYKETKTDYRTWTKQPNCFDFKDMEGD